MRYLPLLFLTLLCSSASAVELTAGPMVGHVTDKSVRLWMQFPVAGTVTVNVFEATRHQGISALRVGLEGPSPFVCDLPLNNLQPNTTYRVEVKFDNEPVKLPGPELVLRTAPAPGEEATFSVAFGSGIQINPQPPASVAATQLAPVATAHKIPIFRAITELKPRAFFFLGNTGLLPAKLDDFPTTHRAAYRYLADFHSLLRREPDLQSLFRTTPSYAVFNDRDFGPQDCAASYVFAPEALVAFQRFWPNPDWGTPANPGCFSMCTYGDADIFLLDTRTFREEKSLLGEAQLTWLENNLKASKAAFKIIGAPCTLWGDDPKQPDADSWSKYPAEQAGFLRWLGDNQLNGVIGIAGNRPAGDLTRMDLEALRYPLYTLGCSTLLAAGDPAKIPENSRRIGQAVAQNTFGTLAFAGQREHRFITLRLHDETGKMRLEQVLLAMQLRPAR